jgi:glycosyltransferase involved in cell wall biosynthesis
MIRTSNALNRPDTKVWIVAPLSPPYGGMSLQAEKLAQKLAGEGFAVEVLPTNPLPPVGLKFLARIPAVRTVVRELQYLGSLNAIRRSRGVVHHLSASDLFFFLHSVPLLLFARCTNRKLILNYRGGKAERFLKSWSRVVVPLLRLADEVAVPSAYLQRVFAKYRVVCLLLPNIADTELFAFKERKAFAPRLFVSRHLEKMYDPERVLRAFRRIQQSVPEATLGIAGDGVEKARLESLVREWGLRGVTFYGAVPYAQLPALYEQHDIYINGSRVDNFPGALVEAACAGLPIVTTRAGGIPEMIEHGRNGLLADIGDEDALAANVLQLLRQPELAQQIARTARTWVEQFSWRRILPQLLQTYGFSAGQDGREAAKRDDLLEEARVE